MGLRAKQRQQRESVIIESAKQLFREKGYKKTSIEMIATEAEVGVATIYKYFGNKTTILTRVTQPELEEIFRCGQAVIEQASTHPSNETYELLHCYLGIGDEWTDKKLFRLFLIPSSDEHDSIFSEIRDFTENMVKGQLQELFQKLIQLGKLPEKSNVENLAKIVFAIFNQEHVHCILNDDVDPKESFKQIKIQLKTLFQFFS